MSERSRHAQALFAPLAPAYDRAGAVLSFGQDPRWRRFLVSRVPAGGHVLDVATGTGLVAEALVTRGHAVTGLDQSPGMLAAARRRFGAAVQLVEGEADRLPFADASFDHLTFTYLLRYVDDPSVTLAELARVVRSGGMVASLEFGVPPTPWRWPWDIHVDVVLPAAGRLVGPGWYEVGRFLGPSIRTFAAEWPIERQLEEWAAAGMPDARARRMSLGAATVVWGTRA